eukprot:gene100-64_t
MEFDLNLYDPITEYEQREKNEVSLKKLRVALKDRFDQSSALDGIKAQLRKQVLAKLLGKEEQIAAAKGHDEAESGLESERGFISETDVCRMLKFNELVSLFHEMQDHLVASESDSSDDINPIIQSLVEEDRTSLLDLILEYCLSLRSEMTQEISVQAGPSCFTARELLDNELFHLEKHFDDLKGHRSSNEGKSFEERIINFQRELEERKNREVELQIRYFKENEVMKIRHEEAAKARATMEAMRQELEFDYNTRLKGHHDREQEAIKRAKEQERLAQTHLYEARQQMERELEEVRARESMLSRKVDLESQGLKLLEIRLKEAQLAMEHREREVRKLESDANQKLHHANEIARKDANVRLQKEFEELNALRYDVNLERRKLEEDKLTVHVDKEGNRVIREEMNKLRELLATREGEVTMLKWSLQQTQQQLQQLQSTRMVATPTTASHHHQQHHSLSLKLADDDLDYPATPTHHHAHAAPLSHESLFQHDRLAAENRLLRSEIDHLRSRADDADKLLTANQQLTRELEAMKTDMHHEKARALGREHKIEELQRLLQEKTQTLESLSRQLDAQTRREKQQQQWQHHQQPQQQPAWPSSVPSSFGGLGGATTLNSPLNGTQAATLTTLLGRLLSDESYERLMAQRGGDGVAAAAATLPVPPAPFNPSPWSSALAIPAYATATAPPPSSTSSLAAVPVPMAALPTTVVVAPAGGHPMAQGSRSPDSFPDLSPIKAVATATSTPMQSTRATSYDPDAAHRQEAAEAALRQRQEEDARLRRTIEENLRLAKEQDERRRQREAQEAEEERAMLKRRREREEQELQERREMEEARREAEERQRAAEATRAAQEAQAAQAQRQAAAQQQEAAAAAAAAAAAETEVAQRRQREEAAAEAEERARQAKKAEAEAEAEAAEEAKRRQEEDEIAEARRRVLERRKQKAAADGAGLGGSTEFARGSWSGSIHDQPTSVASSTTTLPPTAAAAAAAAPAAKRPVFDFAEESDSKIEFDANSDESSGGAGW